MRVEVISKISSFNGNLIIPQKKDWRLSACLKLLNVSNIGYVRVDPWIHSNTFDCHNNVLKYADWYGGERISGYYWVEDLDNNSFLAISHSVIKTTKGDILDITPFPDQRSNNLFNMSTHSSLEAFSSSSPIYGFSFNFNAR